jgi:azurin
MRHSLVLSLSLAALLLAGCGPSEPAVAPLDAPVTEITITGNDRMRFAPTVFTVERGREITVDFRNVGSMPKESMGHNLVIVRPGTNINGFAAAGMAHPTRSYIAPTHAERVVAFSPVLGPGERYRLVFTAPDEPGEYPFVCSFPGHTPAGMVGKMIVQ